MGELEVFGWMVLAVLFWEWTYGLFVRGYWIKQTVLGLQGIYDAALEGLDSLEILKEEKYDEGYSDGYDQAVEDMDDAALEAVDEPFDPLEQSYNAEADAQEKREEQKSAGEKIEKTPFVFEPTHLHRIEGLQDWPCMVVGDRLYWKDGSGSTVEEWERLGAVLIPLRS